MWRGDFFPGCQLLRPLPPCHSWPSQVSASACGSCLSVDCFQTAPVRVTWPKRAQLHVRQFSYCCSNSGKKRILLFTFLYFIFIFHQSWEPLVLKRLNWDVSSVLAIDYLDHILVKLPELCAAGQQNPPSSSPLRSSNILSQSSSSAISSPRSTKRPFSLTTSSSPSSSSSCPSSGQKRFRSCDHFVSCKVPEQSSLSNSFSSLHDTVRRHASTLISLCSTGKCTVFVF